jgi:hypothetical protein
MLMNCLQRQKHCAQTKQRMRLPKTAKPKRKGLLETFESLNRISIPLLRCLSQGMRPCSSISTP